MNIAYDAAHRIFKLDTDHTSYVIAVIDEEGFLCHAYYGDKISDTDVAYLLRTGEHPFVPSRNNHDRSANIAYVKWDMNRQLTDLGSYGLEVKRQGELLHRYVQWERMCQTARTIQ